MKKTALTALLLLILLMALSTPGSNSEPLPPDARADLVRVVKSERKLSLFADGRLLKTYRVSLGGRPIGHKTEEGDQKTPEGRYVLDRRNPNSRYYLSIHISYPNDADKTQAAARGVSPGGDIMIHGMPNGGGLVASLQQRDWTQGCIAVTNEDMDELWRAVPDGTPIEIVP